MADPTDDDIPDDEPEKPDDDHEPNPEGFPFENVGHPMDGDEEKPEDSQPEAEPESEPERFEGLFDRMQRKEIERQMDDFSRMANDPNVRAVLDSDAFLSIGDRVRQNGLGGASEAARQLIRDGDLGAGHLLAERSGYDFGFDRTALLPDSLTDIVRGIGSAWRDGSSFWDDVQLTRQFLADHDVTHAVSSAEASTMSALLANLDSFADVTLRALDAYSITPETFGQMVDSLDRSQLDAITRQASGLLWEEIERRGWTETPPPPRPKPTARPDTPSKQPPREPEKTRAETPLERSAASERIRAIWDSFGTGQATFLGMFVVAAIPFVFSSSSVQTSVHSETDGDVEIHGNTVRGDITAVNNNTVNNFFIFNEELDRIGKDPIAQAELVQQARESCKALLDSFAPELDTSGRSAEQPESPGAVASQAPLDVQPDTNVDTSSALPDDTVNVQPDAPAGSSDRARKASSADVQADTAENGEQG